MAEVTPDMFRMQHMHTQRETSKFFFKSLNESKPSVHIVQFSETEANEYAEGRMAECNCHAIMLSPPPFGRVNACLETKNILPEERKGYRLGSRSCKEQLVIELLLVEQATRPVNEGRYGKCPAASMD